MASVMATIILLTVSRKSYIVDLPMWISTLGAFICMYTHCRALTFASAIGFLVYSLLSRECRVHSRLKLRAILIQQFCF